ncbi:MAG: PDZ domain-containing protein [Chloroflexi bacterium]|nr:PDZ domain-containing protein [Chloroflexota bacterium]
MVVAPLIEELTFTRAIHAPAAEIYRAFTDGDALDYWLSENARVRNAVGGHILLTWNDGSHAQGTYLELEKDQKIVMSWRASGESEDSRVAVRLETADDCTQLTLTHAGLQNPEAADGYSTRWNAALDNLVSFLETGADLRITRRVILGIWPSEFNEEVAKKLGVPVTNGVRVGGVIPGMGAEAAGLQADDVVVEMNGKTIGPEMPIYRTVENNGPGDPVAVTFYRGAEKHTITLRLSGYPVPEKPPTFNALADLVAETYAGLDAELSALYEGVSETQAGCKPAPGEWSANEVIAHLILSERWLQNWIGGLMQGPEIEGWTANAPARIAGVMATFPTTAALLSEMRRSWAETVAIIRAVPAEIAERKSNLWWVSFEVQGFPNHTQQHFTQIREALAFARAS